MSEDMETKKHTPADEQAIKMYQLSLSQSFRWYAPSLIAQIKDQLRDIAEVSLGKLLNINPGLPTML